MASEKIVNLTADNFSEVIHGDKPVLVDFWAAWCFPCRRVAPVLEELAEDYDGLVIGKVNVEEHRALGDEYGVSSLPTFILFENGEAKDRMMGAMSKQVFERFLEKNGAAPKTAAPAAV